ncbi:unnamed protein product [Mytilus edulis]|uniref:Uncharacterized protein n=1 Tax=Mytilus edulis TaxID=6550 RepID=A0A8S3UCN2_MYTED|nr:unnamed protein product [Mytilus edulis]
MELEASEDQGEDCITLNDNITASERARKLLGKGGMPLFPAGRREWNQEEVIPLITIPAVVIIDNEKNICYIHSGFLGHENDAHAYHQLGPIGPGLPLDFPAGILDSVRCICCLHFTGCRQNDLQKQIAETAISTNNQITTGCNRNNTNYSNTRHYSVL